MGIRWRSNGITAGSGAIRKGCEPFDPMEAFTA
jgi:hypothetical protein